MKLRIIPFGGLEGVTKNMYAYEYWEGNTPTDIIVVDCGVGFISHLEALGVDSVIPDVSYLRDKKHLIRALFISHGHEDHIGAIPYVIRDLGSPTVYAPKLAQLLIREKLKEEGIEDVAVEEARYHHDYKAGAFSVRFIHMTHSIPDTAHLFIRTPAGTVYHGSDFKMDLTPVYGDPPDFNEITRASQEGVDLLLSDGLGSEREGYTLSERIVGATFDEEMGATKGRFFMSTFASNISRIRQCVDAALKYHRRVCFVGSSMRRNTTIAMQEKYLRIKREQMIDENQIAHERPNHVCVILTGSQGEYGSALEKIASKRHRTMRIQKGDRILFSSDPIPGNDENVTGVIEDLIEQGADVVYTAIRDQLHASGHGSQEDLKLLVRLVRPRALVPIGTTIRHSKAYQTLMSTLGYHEAQMPILHSGEPLVLSREGITRDEKIPLKEVLVDGTSIGDVGSTILEEREHLGKEGIVLVLVRGTAITLTSRGLTENERKLFPQIIELVSRVQRETKEPAHLKERVTSEVSGFFSRELQRDPIVIPVIE